jgi:hypothetical protein
MASETSKKREKEMIVATLLRVALLLAPAVLVHCPAFIERQAQLSKR